MKYRQKLLVALEKGPLRTGELDIAVLGEIFFGFILGRKTPYCDDLAELVDSKAVSCYLSDNGDVWYELCTDPAQWRDASLGQ